VEGETQLCFCDGEHLHQGVVDAAMNLLSAHGSPTAADHQDHQRPETQRDAEEGRQIAQEPQGDAATLHAADYTAAIDPADLAPVFPSNFRSK